MVKGHGLLKKLMERYGISPDKNIFIYANKRTILIQPVRVCLNRDVSGLAGLLGKGHERLKKFWRLMRFFIVKSLFASMGF
jgi:hypothetical protein